MNQAPSLPRPLNFHIPSLLEKLLPYLPTLPDTQLPLSKYHTQLFLADNYLFMSIISSLIECEATKATPLQQPHKEFHANFHLYYKFSPYVCLSMFANCRSQFLLDRPGRCLKLFVSTESTSCHEFASHFGLAIFYTRKTPQRNQVARASVYLNEAATSH